MIRLCFCYNKDSEILKGAIQKEVNKYPEIKFESYNEDLFTEKKKSYSIKNWFAARMTPFCGIFNDEKCAKGFYSEAKECTEQNIVNFLFDNYAHVKIDIPETSSTLDDLINDYKQMHNE